jgi:hypothetical protein
VVSELARSIYYYGDRMQRRGRIGSSIPGTSRRTKSSFLLISATERRIYVNVCRQILSIDPE